MSVGTSQQWFIGMVVNEEKNTIPPYTTNCNSADGLF
jgi:hypothetical protein